METDVVISNKGVKLCRYVYLTTNHSALYLDAAELGYDLY